MVHIDVRWIKMSSLSLMSCPHVCSVTMPDALYSFVSLVSYQDQDKGVFSHVKLQIDSNWGEKNYTCLYNFRVHGQTSTSTAIL